jgi:hypothetical protein
MRTFVMVLSAGAATAVEGATDAAEAGAESEAAPSTANTAATMIGLRKIDFLSFRQLGRISPVEGPERRRTRAR